MKAKKEEKLEVKKEVAGIFCPAKKIVQIAMSQDSDKAGAACWRLAALCHDGSVYTMSSKNQAWELVAPLS